MPTENYTFGLEEAPAPETLQAINAGLRDYNLQYAPDDRYQALTVVLRQPDGAVAGGLIGATVWGWLYVEILWLEEAARGQGYGGRLLQLAEQEAARRGCGHCHLDTLSFQALPFYLKRGYTVWGELPDHPKGHTLYFLKKILSKLRSKRCD